MADLKLQFSDVKTCPHCGNTLLRTCFCNNKRHHDGLNEWCRRCMQAYRKEYRKTRREQMYEYFLKYNYDITKHQRDSMESNCANTCMLCGKAETRTNQYGVRKLSVDHNHITHKVRGLLCSTCNQALGLFYVDEMGVELLQKAINYVRTNDGRP